jgi:cation transport regulator ChaB
MPKSSRYGPSAAGELPGTLQRSCQQAQALFRAALAEAITVYGEGDQACRAAYAALKKEFEKRGDHWIAKTEPAA